MEPRSATANYDAAIDRYTLQAGNQGAFGLKHQMADLLKIKPQQMRILTGNVGGSFGMKGSPYPEYAGLFHASKLLGRPLKWTDARSAAHRLRQCRPLPGQCRAADGLDWRHAQPRGDLPHAPDRGRDQGGLH